MKMRRVIFICLLFLSGTYVSLAQREASKWYFGNEAGLDFNSGFPVALTDGQLATHEGCSTISDQNGNLLFYSDGINVWDKTHSFMPNGTGLFGHESSTQSAIIVPKAGSKTQYYIFTVDEPDPERIDNKGLNYTLVDLSLNNGFGDVVSSEKNIHLVTYNQNDPKESQLKCSEKITAVAHNDESSIWVITHFKNSFYSFRVDANGVNTNPVISTTNIDVPMGGYKQNGIGYLKVSPNGTKIGVAHSLTSSTLQSGPKTASRQTGRVLLYDFNTTTGTVSNELSLLSNRLPYGLEFSAKSTKLYTTVNNYTNDGIPEGSSLYQFDLSASDIIGSRAEIVTSAHVAGALQLAIDTKIYRAGYSISGSGRSLSAINNPEAKGAACDYEPNAITLSGKVAELGLPPFVQSFFILKFEYKNVCLGDETKFTILDDASVQTVEWDFGDGHTSTERSPVHTYDNPGEYKVSLTKYFAGLPSDPITKSLTIFDKPQVPGNLVEYYQCSYDNITNGLATFNLYLVNPTVSLDTDQIINVFYYHDRASAEQDTFNINFLPFTYNNSVIDEVLIAKVYNPISGCYSLAEVELKIKPAIFLEGSTLYGCDLGNGQGEFHFNLQRQAIIDEFNLPSDSSIKFYPNKNSALFGTENYLPDVYTSGNDIIHIRIDNENICYGTGEFQIALSSFELEAHEELLLCGGDSSESLILSSVSAANDENEYMFQWSNGLTTSTIDVNEPGTYTVMVTNSTGCTKERTIEVVQAITPEIKNIEASNDTVKVTVVKNGDYEYAIGTSQGPYQDSNTFNNVLTGVVTVYVRNKNGCGLTSGEVSVVAYPKFFTPNGDNVNDYWQLDGFNAEFEPESPIFIFDRFGRLLVQVDPISSGWDGTYNGKDLASADFWFKVTLSGGRLLKGHFALKR